METCCESETLRTHYSFFDDDDDDDDDDDAEITVVAVAAFTAATSTSGSRKFIQGLRQTHTHTLYMHI